jgi:hypothetical protein
VVLMGKNTMMKRSIREHAKRTKNEEWLVRSGVAQPETLFAALLPPPRSCTPHLTRSRWPSSWWATWASSSPRHAPRALTLPLQRAFRARSGLG